MSWLTKAAELAAEFGDDVMRAVAKALPREATEAEARAAARTALDRIDDSKQLAHRPSPRASA